MFHKRPSCHEVVNDLHDRLINFFRIVRERGNELADAVHLTPYARSEYEASYEVSADAFEDARRFAVRVWMAHSAGLNRHVGWRNNGVVLPRSMTTRLWNNVPDRIQAAIARLKHVEIECLPALTVIGRYNASDVVLYVDPPYLPSTRTQRVYAHEMEVTDHVNLLHALTAHTGSVVLSGYANPLYHDMLPDWTHVTLQTYGEKGQAREESLWINPMGMKRLGYGPLFDQR